MPSAIPIFCCYARKDLRFLKGLKKHLIPLERQGLISVWADIDISPGAHWEREIDEHLKTAEIILLLVSPDFIASEYCFSIEMKQALERHTAGTTRVIPLLIRPVDIQGTPFANLQFLPRNAKPVISWNKRDEAFLHIVRDIRIVLEKQDTHVEGPFPPIPIKRRVIPNKLKRVVAALSLIFLAASAGGAYLIARLDAHHVPVTVTDNPTIPASTSLHSSNTTLVFDDPLNERNHHNDWFQSEDCQFFSDGFHITTSIKNYIDFCYAELTNFHNFRYEVQIRIVKGMEGGIIYCLDSNKTNLYYFGITRNGDYEVDIITDHGVNILKEGHSSAFYTGFGKLNTLDVVAKENIIKLYINDTYVVTTNDANFTSGQIGIAASALDTPPVEAIFSNAKVWTL